MQVTALLDHVKYKGWSLQKRDAEKINSLCPTLPPNLNFGHAVMNLWDLLTKYKLNTVKTDKKEVHVLFYFCKSCKVYRMIAKGSKVKVISLCQWLANRSLWLVSSLLAVSVKFYWNPVVPICVCFVICATIAELRSCDRDCTAPKAWTIYCLALTQSVGWPCPVCSPCMWPLVSFKCERCSLEEVQVQWSWN